MCLDIWAVDSLMDGVVAGGTGLGYDVSAVVGSITIIDKRGH